MVCAFVLSHFDVGCLWESGLAEASQGRRANLPGSPPSEKFPSGNWGRFSAGIPSTAARCSVIHPAPSYLQTKWDGRNLNNASLVLQIKFGQTTLILPGDIDQSVEPELFQEPDAAPSNCFWFPPITAANHSNPPLLFDSLQSADGYFLVRL